MRDVLRQFLRLPVVMWLYGIDNAQRLVRSVPSDLLEPTAGSRNAFERSDRSREQGSQSLTASQHQLLVSPESASPQLSTEDDMDDRNLSDDMVKLVSYDIVSIARDAERIIHSDSIMVTDNTSSEAFSSWMIAQHMQRGGSAAIAETERKYLRVYFRVKDRWPKQSLYYEERQLATLEGIQKALLEANRPNRSITDGSDS